MWTPKRVVLLVAGFLLFCGAYAAYARVLGGIDGLPALPEQYRRGGRGNIDTVIVSRIEEKLQQAFGIGCAELKMDIQVDSPRGPDSSFVIAARKCDNSADPRQVILTPFSMASIKTVPGKAPEVNTLHGATAVLLFNGPVGSNLDMGKRKLVQAEVFAAPSDPIVIRHFRQSLADAIEVHIPKGPVHFKDEEHLITTEDHVTVMDLQTKPDYMKVEGTGLRVHLTPNQPPADKGHADKPKSEGGGVEKIVLLSAVDMHLYPESGTGFPPLGEPSAPAKPPAAGDSKSPAKPPDHIHITTDGPFVYDLTQSRARFDIPDNAGPLTSQYVTVVRNPFNDLDPQKADILHCDHLELQFVSKSAEAAANPPKNPQPTDGDNGKLDIDWVHAWGNKIDFASGEQKPTGEGKATGEGNDLYYQAATHRSVLKGSPQATLLTDNNEIAAPELEMIRTPDIGPVKGQQLVTATGQGRVHLWNKTTGKRTMHARWQEQFKSRREGEQDVLTFKGRAALVEDEHLIGEDIFNDKAILNCKTLLKADYLQIWLDPPPPAPAGQKPAAAPAASRPGEDVEGHSGGRRPRRVEADGHVEARTPDMHTLVGEQYPVTQRLTMYFKDINDPIPPAPIATKPADPPAGTGPAPIVVPPPDPPPAPTFSPETMQAEKPARPVELCAAFITAYVLRYNPSGKTEIDKLDTEGAVQVIQEPSGEDKGFFIRGDKVNLTRKMAGCNHLKVSSDPKELAELRMGTNRIVGPQVEIDQADNTVDVEGSGYMEMENTTDFHGNPLKKPEILTVHWNRLMHFEGTNAEFVGDIQAEQGHSRLQSKTLRAEFDKPISLNDQKRSEKKDPAKGAESAKVKTLVCDRSVKIEEEAYETLYCLSPAALASLPTAGVPLGVLDKLSPLSGKVFDSREKFSAEVARLLPKIDLEKFQGLVTAQAAFEPMPPRLTGFKSLDCSEMTVQNIYGTMRAIGPGVLRIVQPGGGIGTPVGTAPKAPAKPGAKPAPVEWTLTQVNYGRFGGGLGQTNDSGGWMDADNNNHTALFEKDIQVIHIPWTNDRKKLREPVNPSVESGRLRPGGLYMECEKSLKIYSPEDDVRGGAPSESESGRHIMTGVGRVYLKAVDANGKVFWGTAEVVHYDEAKDMVIFDGQDGTAELYQQDRPGGEPKKLQGKKITYWRKTGEATVEQIVMGSGSGTP